VPAERPSTPQLLLLAWSDVRRGWRPAAKFFLLALAAGFAIAGPLLGMLQQRFIAATGSTAIGNFDIAKYLLSPLGLVFSVVLSAVFLASAMLQFGGLVVIGDAAAGKLRPNYWLAARRVLSRWKGLLALSGLALLALLLAAAPLVAALFATAKWLLSEHDINYYLAAGPPEFIAAVAAAAVIALLVGVLLLWAAAYVAFALPDMILGGQPVRDAIRRSLRLARRRSLRIALAVGGCLLVGSLVAATATFLLLLLGKGLVALAGDHFGWLLVVLGLAAAMLAFVNTVVSFLTSSLIACVVARLYRQALAAHNLEQPAAVSSAGADAAATGAWARRRRWLVPAVAGLVLLAAATTSIGLAESLTPQDRTEISAHRGSSLRAPENTLSAVEQAIADGADFVEVDVQLSSDSPGVVVVTHDETLMRIAKRPLVVPETSWRELHTLDVGGWFDKRFAGERLPKLEEVLLKCKGRVGLIVELKSYNRRSRELVVAVEELLRRHDMVEGAVVMSLKLNEMQQLRKLNPQVKIGYAAAAAVGNLTRLDVDFLAVEAKMATNVLIASAHAEGKEVFVWTVDDPDMAERLIDRGVDNIITNDSATMVDLLRQREGLSNTQRLLLRFRSLFF